MVWNLFISLKRRGKNTVRGKDEEENERGLKRRSLMAARPGVNLSFTRQYRLLLAPPREFCPHYCYTYMYHILYFHFLCVYIYIHTYLSVNFTVSRIVQAFCASADFWKKLHGPLIILIINRLKITIVHKTAAKSAFTMFLYLKIFINFENNFEYNFSVEGNRVYLTYQELLEKLYVRISTNFLR